MWEARREPQHFVSSKLMCWVALDRALRLAEAGRLDGDLACWRARARRDRTDDPRTRLAARAWARSPRCSTARRWAPAC
ncbi:MAG: hypothetical protein MZW92_35020 [Comamonadaceae bacterium]|nr:hypothetical protein [Comamonadaceae bacterium]